MTDALADRDFTLDHKSLFESEDDIFIPGGEPATHRGFTSYLMDEKNGRDDGHKCLDLVIACVNDEFKNNPDVAGEDFNLYVTGHRCVDCSGMGGCCTYHHQTAHEYLWNNMTK